MADITVNADDSEVDKIVNNPTLDPVQDNILPSPGSPVLSNNFNNLTRKLGNKMLKRKSRVKLSDRFNAQSAVEPLDEQIKKFNEESSNFFQSSHLAACLERIETLARNRQHWYDIMVNDEQTDSCFKKPPPVTCSRSHMNISDLVDSSNIIIQNSDTLDTSLPPVKLPTVSSFQTAAGKTLQISDSDIKKQALIFQDIHQPSISGNMYKEKHHNFLKKSDTGQKAESSINTCRVKDNINTSAESGIKKTTTVADQYCAELGIPKDSKCSILAINAEPEDFSKNTSISFTQEISQSGISDTQMLSIVNDYSLNQKVLNIEDRNHSKLHEEQHIFIGFSKNDIEESNRHESNFLRKIANMKNTKITENDISRKRALEVDQVPYSKKIKLNPFPDNFTSAFGGFSSASGKHINVTTKALAKASHIFDGIEKDLRDMQTDESVKDDDTDSYKNHKLFIRSQQQCTDVMIRANSLSEKQALNVERLAGGMVQKTDVAYKSNIDNSLLNNISCKENNENAHPGFSTASGKLLPVNEKSKMKAKRIFGDILDSTPDDSIVRITTKNKIKVLNDAMKEAEVSSKTEITGIPNSSKEIKMNLGSLQNMPEAKLGFTNASGKACQVSKSSLARAKQMFGDLPDNEAESMNRLDSKNKFKLLDEAIKKAEVNMGLQPSSVDDDFQKKQIKNRPFALSTLQRRSPLQSMLPKHRTAEVYDVDTPKKEDTVLKKGKRKLGISSCKQIRISPQNLKKAKLLFDQEVHTISPIKPIELNIQHRYNTPERLRGSVGIAGEKYCSTPLQNSTLAVSITPAKSIAEECPKLDPHSFFSFGAPTKGSMSDWLQKYHEERKLIEARLGKIKERETALSRLHQGKMDDKRCCSGVLYQKKSLSSRLSLRLFYDEISKYEDKNQDLFFVSPENAADFHFKCDTVSNTEDGATIIPNMEDLVGLSEIQVGIETTPGVEARLIPKDWIKNHYRWIVWKLASYERKYPKKCKSILSIENVVQQLKYRYDREIDKVERPALRRILERDDAAQKRMVLCVSAIRRKGLAKYELELTDGWYAVRTVIDEPLSAQVYGKVQIGTKLITCGAELLNCDGCHPLEATDLTCLKINYNNTRRARWYTKLGYQRYPQPFPVKICSIHPLGGIIGAIKICIVRVYPLKFLEKLGTNSVWRNKKAEEKRAQEWENDISRKIEKIQSDGKKDSQGARDEINNLITRDVAAMLRLLVIDLLDSEHRTHNFHVWMPSERHLQDLREGTSMTAYYVLPKKNGDLSSCGKTLFKPMDSKHNLPSQFLRKLTLIEDISPQSMADFREFDTVGVIVKTVIEENFQKVWIAGLSGRLLLIRINEGPKLCSLLDQAKRGQPITVSNLVLSSSSKVDALEASANHYSVFSLYPMQKHLQNGLDAFKKEFVQDLDMFLNDCDNKIKLLNYRESIKRTSASELDDSDEDTLTTSRLTSTDVALSLIDIDKFI